jgi:predicted transcriptional regulator
MEVNSMDPFRPEIITPEQRDLIDRFIAAYNVIDHHLRTITRSDNKVTFSELISKYKSQKQSWRDDYFLRMMGDLRNAIVHGNEKKGEYLSVPIPSIVENIERIRDDFKKPEKVFPKFKRDVLKFRIDNSIIDVLKEIKNKNYSQFPILDGEIFKGLLTENGIVRWLAFHGVGKLSLIELEDIFLGDVLGSEEEKENHLFISRESTLLDAESLFVRKPNLEALLITENGKSVESLMGIITRWDIINNWN